MFVAGVGTWRRALHWQRSTHSQQPGTDFQVKFQNPTSSWFWLFLNSQSSLFCIFGIFSFKCSLSQRTQIQSPGGSETSRCKVKVKEQLTIMGWYVTMKKNQNVSKVILFHPLKTAEFKQQVDSPGLEQTSMVHYSLEPLQGSMETFDPRENWTHFGQQLVMVRSRSLTPSRWRTLRLEVWDIWSSKGPHQNISYIISWNSAVWNIYPSWLKKTTDIECGRVPNIIRKHLMT